MAPVEIARGKVEQQVGGGGEYRARASAAARFGPIPGISESGLAAVRRGAAATDRSGVFRCPLVLVSNRHYTFSYHDNRNRFEAPLRRAFELYPEKCIRSPDSPAATGG